MYIYIYMGHDIYTFFGNYKPTYNLGAPSSSSPKIERTVGNRRTFFRKKYHLIHLIYIYISKSNHIFSEKLLALIWGPIFFIARCLSEFDWNLVPNNSSSWSFSTLFDRHYLGYSSCQKSPVYTPWSSLASCILASYMSLGGDWPVLFRYPLVNEPFANWKIAI